MIHYIQFFKPQKKFYLKDICLIGIQCLDRLELIHTKNIIHRDINPENFLFGEKRPKNNICYRLWFK